MANIRDRNVVDVRARRLASAGVLIPEPANCDGADTPLHCACGATASSPPPAMYSVLISKDLSRARVASSSHRFGQATRWPRR